MRSSSALLHHRRREEAEVRDRDVVAEQRESVDAAPDVPVAADVGDARSDVAVGALDAVSGADPVRATAVEQALDRLEEQARGEGLVAAPARALEHRRGLPGAVEAL